jgi:hypothetical protein
MVVLGSVENASFMPWLRGGTGAFAVTEEARPIQGWTVLPAIALPESARNFPGALRVC